MRTERIIDSDPVAMCNQYQCYTTKLEAALHDENLTLDDRLTAGAILMYANMCLRSAEFCNLHKDLLCFNSQDVPCFKMTLNIMGQDQPSYLPVGHAMKGAAAGYLKLREQCAIADTSPYLFILDKKEGTPETLKKGLRKFCGRNATLMFFRRFYNYVSENYYEEFDWRQHPDDNAPVQ